jgi:integrase
MFAIVRICSPQTGNFVATVLRRKAMMSAGKTRPARTLNAGIIRNLKPDPAGPYRVPDLRCKGLGLRVAPDGGKTWDPVYRIKGKGVRRPSLGRTEDVGLEQARSRTNELTSAARQGRDLIAEEAQAMDEAERGFTIEALLEEYLKRRVRGRLRSARRVENRLRRTLSPIFKRKAAEIRRRDLRELFDSAADMGHAPEADKRRVMVTTMFKWAIAQDIVEANPADGLTAYDSGKARDRVLTDDEIQALWRWEDLPAAMLDVLKLQLLLGARVSEVGGMHGDEISTDPEGRMLWALPPGRTKNGRGRTTPLVGLANEIVSARLALGQPLLFGVAENTAGKRLRESGRGFRTHDLRRTAASGMAELAPLDVISAILGHSSEKDTRVLIKHYMHSDLVKRKELALKAWDARVRAIISDAPAEPGKVIKLTMARG